MTGSTSTEAVLGRATYPAPGGNSDTALIWGDY